MTNDAIIARRRRLIASLRLRGLSLREITDALAKQGERHPRSGKPWSLAIVHQDVTALTIEWRQMAAVDETAMKAAHLAEIREVRRAAWGRSDLAIVLRALEQEARLLGLDAPQKIDVEHKIRTLAAAYGYDPDEAVAEAQRVLREARG